MRFHLHNTTFFGTFLTEMISRKLALYSEQARTILDFQVIGEGDNMRVDVVYSLLEDEVADFKDRNGLDSS